MYQQDLGHQRQCSDRRCKSVSGAVYGMQGGWRCTRARQCTGGRRSLMGTRRPRSRRWACWRAPCWCWMRWMPALAHALEPASRSCCGGWHVVVGRCSVYPMSLRYETLMKLTHHYNNIYGIYKQHLRTRMCDIVSSTLHWNNVKFNRNM